MSSNTNVGNISYSLNKTNVTSVFSACVFSFLPIYFIFIIISILYIFRLRVKQYRFPENEEDPIDSEVINFFCSITTKSPFGILNVKRHFKELEDKPELYKDIYKRDPGFNLSSSIKKRYINGNKSVSVLDESKGKKFEKVGNDGEIIESEVGFRPTVEGVISTGKHVGTKLSKIGKKISDAIQRGGERINEPEPEKKKNDFSCSVDNESTNFIGLSDHSYILIIISYAIPTIIILEGLVRNLLFSIYSSMTQLNSNNNPYNNPYCITKTAGNSAIVSGANYSIMLTLSYIFIIPFIVPLLIKILKFDNFDIKKNSWFCYVVLFLIFYPLFFIFISKAALYKKLEIFPALNNFFTQKDYNFTNYLKSIFSFKFSTVVIFLFIIISYLFYKFVFINLRSKDTTSKLFNYLLIFGILFLFLPLFFIYFCTSLLFLNKEVVDPNINVIESINKERLNNQPINTLYELIVKYNYPCFKK